MTEREEDVFERKETKKDKGYVAFRPDDDSVGEEEVEDSRYKTHNARQNLLLLLTTRILY